ncbi:MAG: hypothetical protein ACI4SQ_03860 [Eubacterium sp.]
MNIKFNQWDDPTVQSGKTNIHNANSIRSALVKKRANKLVDKVYKSDKEMDLGIEEMKKRREDLLVDTTKQLKEFSALKDQHKEMLSQAEDPVMVQNIKDVEDRMTEIWKKVEENRTMAKAYGEAVSNVQVERLKSHAMVDASNQAEDLLIQSAKELAASLLEEAKNNIEENFEQTKEQAEKVQEKQQNEESGKAEDTLVQQIVKQSEKKEDVDKKIKKMIDDLNLLMDDIKGIEVDTNI